MRSTLTDWCTFAMTLFCLWTRVFLDFLGSVSNQGKGGLGRVPMLHRRRLDGSDRDKEVVVLYRVLVLRLEA